MDKPYFKDPYCYWLVLKNWCYLGMALLIHPFGYIPGLVDQVLAMTIHCQEVIEENYAYLNQRIKDYESSH